MQDFQQRVIDEHADLSKKVAALLAFSNSLKFKELSAQEKSRLHRQYRAMTAYVDVLTERIAAFVHLDH